MGEIKGREANCSCGQLKLRLSGEPQVVSSCHCLACQRRTGAVFGSTAFFGREQVEMVEGERRTWARRADSGNILTFHFCPTCGSSVYWESNASPGRVAVAVGCFADPGFPAPVRTVWTQSKHGWLPFPAGIPHHERNPR